MTYRTGDHAIGHQYILDAIDLAPIASASYDFILSSHSLEHIANPLKALKEWLRVLKPGGSITMILPDSRYTFDHKRPITRFEHLLEDYRNNTGEDDLTHLEEICALHDFTRDAGVKDQAGFRERSLHNIDNRCLHQHVYDLALLRRIFAYLELKVVLTDASFPHHLTIVGVKN
ncbi:methyltransferase domain-containing protein [Pedobacter sp. HMF7056]|uniref:Methyltransferase domain-containing protein n=2 Tax=Hufsiella ginkgonis TaxID=2695274 RepID=A0A7K1Y2M4_9SPHI|nr:methyltransferase domain-containing protein [Hufsiella ginkgonis]